MPQENMNIEDVLLAVSQKVGGLNIKSAARMNKALVVFLTEVEMVDELIETGLEVNNMFLQLLPLSSPSKKVVISNVPPFIKDETLKGILQRYGKVTAPIKMIPLGLKNPDIKHIMSFRRFTYIIPNAQYDPLEVAIKISIEGKDYTIFISTEQMRCYVCGDHGHVRQTCPRSVNSAGEDSSNVREETNSEPQNREENTNTVTGEQPEQRAEISDASQSENAASQSKSEENTCLTQKDTEAQSVVTNENESEEGKCSQWSNVSTDNILSDDDSDHGSESEGSFVDMEETGSQAGSLETSDTNSRLYSVKQISIFLDKTKGTRNPQMEMFFPDLKSFLASSRYVMTNATLEEFNRQKRYRLKKIMTKVKKMIQRSNKKV